jgi:4-alpha-glucanotransferase
MNVPSTVGDNWSWRLTADKLTPQVAEWLLENTRLYGRTAY